MKALLLKIFALRLMVEDNHHAKKTKTGVNSNHSAEFNVNIKGIITAQFRITVGMKCAHATVCRSFSRTRSQFFQERNHPDVSEKWLSCYFRRQILKFCVLPSGWRAAGEKEKKKRHQVSFGLITGQVLLIELFVQLTRGMISDYSYVFSFGFVYLVNGCGSLSWSTMCHFIASLLSKAWFRNNRQNWPRMWPRQSLHCSWKSQSWHLEIYLSQSIQSGGLLFLCRCLCVSAILIFSPCTDLTDSNWITRCRLDLDSTIRAADFVGL